MADKEVRVKIIGDTSDLTKKLSNLKKDLKDMTGIGSTTMSKLINNEPVSMAVMIKICIALKCNIGDVMDVILWIKRD